MCYYMWLNIFKKKIDLKLGGGGSRLNPNTLEAEAGGFLSIQGWQVPGRQGLHRDSLSQKNHRGKKLLAGSKSKFQCLLVNLNFQVNMLAMLIDHKKKIS